MQPNDRLKGVTAAFSKAGLAEGTNAACIKTNAPNGAGTDFAINGIGYHKADTDNIAMTALAVQADLTTCLYGIWIDSAGAVSITKGTAVLTADLTNDSAFPPLPVDVADKCQLGVMRIVMSGGTFTCGTTDLSGAGVTATFFDALGGPVRLAQVI